MIRNVWTDFQNEVTFIILEKSVMFANMTTKINLSIVLLTLKMIKKQKMSKHYAFHIKLTDKFLAWAAGFWISFFWPSSTCGPCQSSLWRSVARCRPSGPPRLGPRWHWNPSQATDRRWPVSLRCTLLLYSMQSFVFIRKRNWLPESTGAQLRKVQACAQHKKRTNWTKTDVN